MSFVKAVRKQAKLRLALTGPSGSGKTYSAILLAKGMGGKLAVIDTEHGSASLYCDLTDFDVMELAAPYTPERYIAAIQAAEKAGYDTLLIDSITHEWNGTGGMLQANEKLALSKYKGNTWSAWSESDPRHRTFVDAILQTKMHVIVTMRSKTETSSEKDSNGKTKILQLGMKAEQRDGIIYEFTTVLDLVHGGHFATATKDRTGLFGGDPQVITADTGSAIMGWLGSGVEVEPEPEVTYLTASQIADIEALAEECGVAKSLICKAAKVDSLEQIASSRIESLVGWVKSKATTAPQAA
ncbi:MAG: hypothetical protein JWQ01_4818 [Massilia sp.]|nr:hypothetical protein [Massilia sp.]